jgi:hypothetical protein
MSRSQPTVPRSTGLPNTSSQRRSSKAKSLNPKPWLVAVHFLYSSFATWPGRPLGGFHPLGNPPGAQMPEKRLSPASPCLRHLVS